MKYLIQLALLVSLVYLSACAEEDITAEQGSCDVMGTVRDYTGTDGCGFIFEDDDGNVYEPLSMYWPCPTGVSDEDLKADPLYNFQYVDGKRISFSYELSDAGSICMVGKVAIITCLEDLAK